MDRIPKFNTEEALRKINNFFLNASTTIDDLRAYLFDNHPEYLSRTYLIWQKLKEKNNEKASSI